MDRRCLARVALLALLSFCVSYAAPVGFALFLTSRSDCCSGHACCNRTHKAGWIAANSGCAGQCAGSFPVSPVAPALSPGAALAGILAADLGPVAARPSHREFAAWPAFLYQRPPPPVR
ncbi:MAG TPA: hypothetical protein VGH38_03830 [Bryobacteraceae bacterium]